MVMAAVAERIDKRRLKPPTDLFGPVPVPTLWPGDTFVCIGSGPSLTQADVDYCRDRARVIAIKDAIQLAPWADVLYAAGFDNSYWWQRVGPTLDFAGLRYTVDPESRAWASVLRMGSDDLPLAKSPDSLALGKHSGYQAINLAVHLGAKRIVLLGYDMRPATGKDHFFGAHPHGRSPNFELFLKWFPAIVEPLEMLDIQVVNASRDTALTIFPTLPIEAALP
jgi:hypothetical protein